MKTGTSYGVAADGELYLYGMIIEEALEFIKNHPDFYLMKVYKTEERMTWERVKGTKIWT